MLNVLVERGSWVICKLGMPLVFLYHAVLTSTFLNTTDPEAQGLEKWANHILSPVQYLCEGKVAICTQDELGYLSYRLERRFDYQNHFFMKTTASVTLLPFSLTVGSVLKGIAYLSRETQDRAAQISQVLHPSHIVSNEEKYRLLGMEIGQFQTAEMIDPPRWKRQPGSAQHFEKDVEALKEIVHLLSKHNVPFWLDCGSCLGTYQYGGAIPRDWDIDIGVLYDDFTNLKHALSELDPEKYVVQDWSSRAYEKSYLKVFVRESGGMIDLYHFAIDSNTQSIYTVFSNETNIFMPTSWKKRERRYTTPIPFAHVFPLKKAIFEGIEVPVPHNTVRYLQTFYGENLAPARLYNEITGQYEKDLTHPYWSLPDVH